MQIQSARFVQRPMSVSSAQQQTRTETEVADAKDSFVYSEQEQGKNSLVRSLLGVTVGATVGVLAGLRSGTFAGLAGAGVSALPAAFAGGISGALIAERFGQADSQGIVAAGLFGAAIGGFSGAAGGGMLAYQISGVKAAVSLGLVGAATGLLATSSN